MAARRDRRGEARKETERLEGPGTGGVRAFRIGGSMGRTAKKSKRGHPSRKLRKTRARPEDQVHDLMAEEISRRRVDAGELRDRFRGFNPARLLD